MREKVHSCLDCDTVTVLRYDPDEADVIGKIGGAAIGARPHHGCGDLRRSGRTGASSIGRNT